MLLVATLTTGLLAVLALGFHVFSAAPERPANRAFAAFAWLMALWLANDIAFWGFHGPDEDGRGWATAAFLIALLMQLAYLGFAWTFPDAPPVPRRAAALVLAPGLAVAALILAGRATGPVGFRDGAFSIAFTPWTYICGAYIYLVFALGRTIAARRRAATADPALRRQIDGVMLAPLATGLLSSAAIVGLPLLGRFELLPYAGFAILLGTALHGRAILGLRMFLPASVLDRVRIFPVTAKLALAVAAASFVAVLAVLAVARASIGPLPAPAGGGASPWVRALVFGLAAASIPAMGLIFLAQRIVTRPIRAITEAAFEVAGGRTDVRAPEGGGDEVGVLAAAFNDMVGRLERDLHVLRDMSEGLLRTERLATAGALAAGVAHEVNNPLAAISSLVQTARGRAGVDDRTRELLDDALREMDRIAGALRDLLELARPRAAARRACDLNAIAEGALRLVRYDRRFRGVPVEARLAPDLPELHADPDRLQQVAMNLLLNARDALDGVAGAGISVTTRLAGPGALELEVADTGRGIAKEHLARVGEPFFTTKPAGAGTGLGLSVCRAIAREHDGRLTVESEPGKGTRVVLALPAGDSRMQEKLASEPVPGPNGGRMHENVASSPLPAQDRAP